MKTTDIITTLSNYHPGTLVSTDPSAAVLILLMQDKADNLQLVLTKRSETIASYVGDYCFPGGTKEATDTDLKLTAERETQEELNLLPSHYRIIGQLDDFQDRYGNLVRPFIALITAEDLPLFIK